MRSAVRIALKRDRRDRHNRTSRELAFQLVVRRLAVSDTQPLAVYILVTKVEARRTRMSSRYEPESTLRTGQNSQAPRAMKAATMTMATTRASSTALIRR
jgi:hypothetical protein